MNDILVIILFCITTIASVSLFKVGFDRVGSIKWDLMSLLSWLFDWGILLALVSAFAARFLFYLMINDIGLQKAYLITSIAIPLTLVTNYLIFKESLSYYGIIGAILITLGVAIIGI